MPTEGMLHVDFNNIDEEGHLEVLMQLDSPMPVRATVRLYDGDGLGCLGTVISTMPFTTPLGRKRKLVKFRLDWAQ